MANFTKVTDNGQIEIAWELLEVSEETVSIAKSVINGMATVKNKLVAVDKYDEYLELYFSDERFYDGELIYGAYSTVTINVQSGRTMFNSFGKSGIEKFGFVKEVK